MGDALMALLPLKNTVTITPVTKDAWGEKTQGEPIEVKCRFEESSNLVTNNLGKEVASQAKIYFDKDVIIGYDDIITYTDAGNQVVKARPINIKAIRFINGKSVLLVVTV